MFCGNSRKYKGKTKMEITRHPLNGYLSKIRFELRRTYPNYWWKKFYQHTVVLRVDVLRVDVFRVEFFRVDVLTYKTLLFFAQCECSLKLKW